LFFKTLQIRTTARIITAEQRIPKIIKEIQPIVGIELKSNFSILELLKIKKAGKFQKNLPA
jgi:hypothetical protein